MQLKKPAENAGEPFAHPAQCGGDAERVIDAQGLRII